MMTNQDYLKHLQGQKVPTLQELYEKTFQTRPPTRYLKKDLIEKLHDQFCKINTSENAEEVVEDPVEEKGEATPAEEMGTRTKNGMPSRRSLIIEAIQEGIWDTATLAEALHEKNPEEWPVDKNKAAVSGTIADLRANKNWKIKIDDKGRITVEK